MQRIAQDGLPVVLVLHQPRQEIFDLIDQVILLVSQREILGFAAVCFPTINLCTPAGPWRQVRVCGPEALSRSLF